VGHRARAWRTNRCGRIVWGDRLYVTSAISPGAFKAPSTGIFGNDYAADLARQGLSDDEVVKRVVNRDIELTSPDADPAVPHSGVVAKGGLPLSDWRWQIGDGLRIGRLGDGAID
jgi:hypothetical protein